MLDFDLQILRCPLSGEQLHWATAPRPLLDFSPLPAPEQVLVNTSGQYWYPVLDGILVLLPHYARLANGQAATPAMAFDKDRVFRYYNEIHYEKMEDASVYADSRKFLDYRPVARAYQERALGRVKEHLPEQGQYLLDVASGPIGLAPYLELSRGFAKRICVDLSINALRQAQQNLGANRGIFICGDITQLPLQDSVCCAVMCQHTLYHVPKDEQARAIAEMYRVLASGGPLAIVYNWFYHSWLMNLALLPWQLYRIMRHLAGKVYSRLRPQRARLYFFPHSPGWFRRLGYGDQLTFHVWRTLNTQFLRWYVHGSGGARFLAWVQRQEERYPRILGLWGDYPLIVIKKPLKR